MPYILFALATLAYIVFLAQLLRLGVRKLEAIVILLFAALCFDNLALLVSDSLHDASREILGFLRYAAHVTILPLLMQAARMLAARSGVDWAAKKTAKFSHLDVGDRCGGLRNRYGVGRPAPD